MSYVERNQTLALMGFASYGDYLDSPLWKRIRIRAFAKLGKKCAGCRGLAVQIHHVSYSAKVLSGQTTSGLVPLCEVCHTTIEFKPDGAKCSHDEANSRLKTLVRKWIQPKRKNLRKREYSHSGRQGVPQARVAKKPKPPSPKILAICPNCRKLARAWTDPTEEKCVKCGTSLAHRRAFQAEYKATLVADRHRYMPEPPARDESMTNRIELIKQRLLAKKPLSGSGTPA